MAISLIGNFKNFNNIRLKKRNNIQNKEYKHFRLYCTKGTIRTDKTILGEIEIYDNDNIRYPTVPLTSNNSNGYIVSADSITSVSSYDAYNAFNHDDDNSWASDIGFPHWIKIEMPEPITFKRLRLNPSYFDDAAPATFVFEGSNTGDFNGEQDILISRTDLPPSTYTDYTFTDFESVENTTPTNETFQYIRLYVNSNNGDSSYLTVGNINYIINGQSHPTNDMLDFSQDGYTVTVSSSVNTSTYAGWHAFHSSLNSSYRWLVSKSNVPCWINLRLPSLQNVSDFTTVEINPGNHTSDDWGSRSIRKFTIYTSNDGSTWTERYVSPNIYSWSSTGAKKVFNII